MKIKDVENLTGISKANIRFYESEGLISPRREENGYRSYTDEDLEILMRIRLLRSLDVPIEALKAMHKGTAKLDDVLIGRKEEYAQQRDRIMVSEEIIERILQSDEGFDTLDAERYLQMLEEQGRNAMVQDAPPKQNHPWRRYFARSFDQALYNMVLFALLPSLYGEEALQPLLILAQLVLLILIEPLLLWLFQATPGKAIFGIRVTSLDGGRLTYRDAMDRTFLVLQHGIGFRLPFLQEYLSFKSLKQAEEGKELLWEENSELTFQDGKNWRYALYVVCHILIMIYPMKLIIGQSQLELQSGYTGEDPLGHDYRVKQVLYGQNESLPLIGMSMEELRFYEEPYTDSEYTTIGSFEYVPTEHDPEAGVWRIDLGMEQYELRLDEDGVILDYRISSELQYSWLLSRVDTMAVGFRYFYPMGYVMGSLSPGWFAEGAWNGDPDPLRFHTLDTDGTVSIAFAEGAPEVLTLTAQTYHGDSVTTEEITLAATKNGTFKLQVDPEGQEGAYTIYHVAYETGEYIFGFRYE